MSNSGAKTVLSQQHVQSDELHGMYKGNPWRVLPPPDVASWKGPSILGPVLQKNPAPRS